MAEHFTDYSEFILQAQSRCIRYKPKQQSGLPLVSICIPVRNAARTIERAIESILDQSYPAIELVVVDGGSSDGTLETLMGFEKIDILYTGSDKNAEEAINRAICLSTGNLFCIVGADDWITRDHISHCVSRLIEAKADLVIPALAMVTENVTDFLALDKLKSTVMYEMPVLPGIGWVATRKLFETVGLFNTSIKVASDFDFLLRAVRAGSTIDYEPNIYYHHTTGGNSMVSPIRTLFDTRRVVISNGGHVIVANAYFLKWVAKLFIRLALQKLVPARVYGFIVRHASRRRSTSSTS